MRTIKASVLHGTKDLRLETRSIGTLEAGELQIVVRSTGICGSDLHYYTHFRNGDIQVQEPLTLGHESAGVVIHVGPGVAEEHFKVGDKVALEVGEACTRCDLCSQGRYNICREMRFRSSAKSFPHSQGTLQEIVNHPMRLCHKLPPSTSLDAGALCEPLSVAIHASKRATCSSTDPRGKVVVVFGAGTIGLLVAAVAKINGARTVVIVDVDQGRCDFATKYGFSHTSYTASVNHGKDVEETMKIAQELAQSIKSSLGEDGNPVGEFDVAFECSGAPACLQAAIYAAKPGGRVMIIGMGNPIQTLPISAAAHREVDLIGVFRYANSYPEAVKIISSEGPGYPNFSKLVTHRFKGLDKVEEAFKMAASTTDDQGNPVLKVVVKTGED